jgi:superfamily II DNA or RNA helicase
LGPVGIQEFCSTTFDETMVVWDNAHTMSRASASTGSETKVRPARKAKSSKTSAPVPYHHKPDSLSVTDWQKALRKQFVPEQTFKIERLSTAHPFFGDYSVFNPASGNSYKVALRDGGNGLNYCDCLDFRTNCLETCKHIEAVLQTVGKKRGAKKAFKAGFVPPYTAVYLHYGETRRVRVRIGTDNAEAFAALAREYFDDELVLIPESQNRFETFLSRAAALDDGFRCYDDALAFILAQRESERRRMLIEMKYAAPDSTEDLLKTRLYPYQRNGIRFAAAAGRSLIADEMGLGKTIQAIGTAELLKREMGIERVLVVCPTSLKYQWRSEITKFTDSSVCVIEGQSMAREKQYRGDGFYKIVSYHALMHDTEAVSRMAPDLVILDEAQRIKNWKTRIARTVKNIESPFALVLTGTPLENNLEELYSIVSFIDPYKLGPFWKFLAEHQLKDETGKVTGYQGLREIGTTLSDITLRRRKRDVLAELPERIDKRIFVPMTEQQRNRHEEFSESVAMLLRKWRRMGHLSEQERQRLLILLNQMRMSCDSTYILDQDLDHRHDTKIGELMSILDESLVDPEQKVVVFSQWERMTRLVTIELDKRGIGYRNLHGGVPSVQRKELFDSFNNIPECRVFVSTDAGSTGLNLQSASILVNLDMPWNPAVLEQRIGRIHRIGQKKNVTILNFVSIETIESRMLGLIGFKSELAHGILDGGEDAIFMSDSKHSQFMSAVAEIIVVPDSSAETVQATMEASALTVARAEECIAEEIESAELAGQSSIISDNETTSSTVRGRVPLVEPQELIANGISFFTELSHTIAAPGGAQALVLALSETDPKTGKIYLKIPIESSTAAADAISALFGLFLSMSTSTKSNPDPQGKTPSAR